MFAKVAEGFFTHIDGLDRHSTTVASKRGMELTDNQNTKKELVINFLLLGTQILFSFQHYSYRSYWF